ncbi:F-box associated domain type 1 [Arabidopsis suecica]|uniref:F-box associated domain type 1 n=1 Tax=Arabidopsis suecica TaxID=45249 RepID=A0A8T2BNM8_ARASU|nr:F-box associated domain type 1 [Arabidopsis suecica]
MSDLPVALVEEILSRVPLTSLSSVRSTCKTWNDLSRNHIFGKTRKQFLGFMVMDSRVYSMKFDLQRLRNNGDFVYSPIKRVSILQQLEIVQVFHWDGLLLCVIRDNRWRVVWNPYLGETRWIKPINKFHRYKISDMFAFGYDNNNKNRNHKILRFLDVFEYSDLPVFFEIYDFNSNAWRVLDVDPHCDIKCGVSLKGNTYFFAREKVKGWSSAPHVEVFLLCFDFTAERFGPRLPLPFNSYVWFSEHVTLSCVRDEHLAVLYRRYNAIMEIYITTKIEPNVVSWSNFLKVDLTTFPDRFYAESFFIDEEKKVAVVFDSLSSRWTYTSFYRTAYIIGESGYFKSVKFGETPDGWNKPVKSGQNNPLMFSSYVPSLVKLQINQRGKRKGRDY